MKKHNQKTNFSGLGQVSRRRFLRATGLTMIAGTAGSLLVACGEEASPVPGPIEATTEAAIVPGGQPAPASPAAGQTALTPTTNPARPSAPPAPTQTPVSTNPLDTANTFLKAWGEKRYADMYALLTINAKNFITQEKFVERYTNITAEATISSVQAVPAAGLNPPVQGQSGYNVPFKASFKTARVGDFNQDNSLPLQAEGNRWRVEWTPAVIFKQLDNTTYLVRMVRTNSPRGQIIARGNVPLSAPVTLFQVYVVPGQIENEEQVLTPMSQLLGLPPEKIKDLYKNGQPTWRMPIKDLPASTPPDTLDRLRALKGVFVDEADTRGYPQGASAAHIVGYVNSVNADDLKALAAKGYTEDDKVGRSGVEAWGEDILAGGFGGKLTIIQRDGGTISTLAERPSTPASNLILNLDMKIQKAAEVALGERMGSIVVMNPVDGAVLALANFPSYDPNLFISGLTTEQFKALNDDKRRPFQNRAVNGGLPVGSTFKAITMAAALEKLGINSQTRFTCTGHWTGLGEQFAKDCYLKSGHGSISLFDGLVASCDVVFYELGKRLDELDSNIIPSFAKAFGLGSSPGMQGLYDSPGQVPDPKWKQEKLGQGWVRGDAVNLGIGQGYLLASPLQMAAAYAAIANGGDVPVPRLVERAEGGQPRPFTPQSKSKIPVSEANLAEIRRALLNVTQSGSGTGNAAFGSSRIKVAGKTGTAESGQETPHAWFLCYAPATQPKYVIAVCLENAGFGNALAAPTARKLVDTLPF